MSFRLATRRAFSIINPAMGKYSKRRFCPALGREITPADCGENRITRHPCPADCEFNPFALANYNTFLELEDEVIGKGHDWYLKTAPNRARAEWELSHTIDKPPGEGLALQMELMFGCRDADGRNCSERWEAAGFPDLKNDERIIQRAVNRSRVGLLEVHRILDDRLVECVDLLDDNATPILLCDRSLAARACRFSTVLTFHFALPHYWRMLGFALAITPLAGLGPRGVVEELVRHLGGPDRPAGWTPWFADHLNRVSRALVATNQARWEQTVASTDVEFGKAVYELRAPFAKCRARLDAVREVEPDDLTEGERDEGFAEARAWLEVPTEGGDSREDTPLFGRVLLGQSHIRLEAFGGERLQRFRAAVEGTLGNLIRFTAERRDDLSSRLKSRHPEYDRALVPPRLLEEPTILSFQSRRGPGPDSPGEREAMLVSWEQGLAQAWLDAPLPGLDDKTPREAATDPALRPRLLQLLKDRVRELDEHNRRTGGTRDLNWMLRELGAEELIFAPPPPRPPTDDPAEEDAEDESD